jgi:hypothetical protein
VPSRATKGPRMQHAIATVRRMRPSDRDRPSATTDGSR